MLRGEKRGFFGLTEPSGGSDPARAIRTRAVKDGNDWVINGSKVFISGADRADFGLVFARTDAEKGRGGITCFLVDTDMQGFHVRRVVHTLRSSHYATELQFEDLRVPRGQRAGRGRQGLRHRQRPPHRASASPMRPPASASPSRRRSWPSTTPSSARPSARRSPRRQAIQWMIVDNEIDIRTSLWLTLAAAHKADRGEPYRIEAGMAKLVASEAGGRVVDRSMQIHGGYGMTKDLPVRALVPRDAHPPHRRRPQRGAAPRHRPRPAGRRACGEGPRRGAATTPA